MEIIKEEKIIEAILFVAGEPVPIEKICRLIKKDFRTTKKILNDYLKKCELEKSGVVIIEVNDSYQMCTNPIYFEYIESLYKTSDKKILTQSLMETLSIVAYKQPVTKMEIEEIRGVSADHAINKLIEYNLVCEKGRLDVQGKPIIFGTTNEFLKYFGYNNLSQLPELLNNEEIIKTLEDTEEIKILENLEKYNIENN